MERCESCAYYVAEGSECRRNAPQPMSSPAPPANLIAKWPRVDGGGCGEHQPFKQWYPEGNEPQAELEPMHQLKPAAQDVHAKLLSLGMDKGEADAWMVQFEDRNVDWTFAHQQLEQHGIVGAGLLVTQDDDKAVRDNDVAQDAVAQDDVL